MPILFASDPNRTDLSFNRYSIWVAEPAIRIEAAPESRNEFRMIDFDGRESRSSNFKKTIESVLSTFELLKSDQALPWGTGRAPFTGGLAGAISYEFGTQNENVAPRESDSYSNVPLPSLALGAYPVAYVADHVRREACWIRRNLKNESGYSSHAIFEKMKHALEFAMSAAPASHATSEISILSDYDWRKGWQPSLDRVAYEKAVARILEYIRAGDVYQVNLTVRHRRKSVIPSEKVFARMLSLNPAPFSVFMRAGGWTIMGSSPELLLNADANGRLETRPIKGTLRRVSNATPDADRAAIEALQSSAKDRAEHLMIVDLERNDLGRVCEFGSVRVNPLMEVESYAGLHHMVSGVEGRLRQGLSPIDALLALFPGGSVTGAPKIRAMQIIRELEPVARNFYTGAMGWITTEGEVRMNLAIRTLIQHDHVLDTHVGGGIVADSDAEKEWEECRLKGAALAAAVGDSG